MNHLNTIYSSPQMASDALMDIFNIVLDMRNGTIARNPAYVQCKIESYGNGLVTWETVLDELVQSTGQPFHAWKAAIVAYAN